MEVGGKMGACEEVKKGMKRGGVCGWGEVGRGGYEGCIA